MKKIMTFALALCTLGALCVGLAGCTTDESETNNPYFLPTIALTSEEGAVFNRADIVVEGDAENSKENIPVAEAWNIANTILDKNVTITLLGNWVTTLDESGKMVFGSGAGFQNGWLYPVDRAKKTCSITLDLNGYTIYRATSSTGEGRIFELRKDGTFTIKNGTVTGGSTSKEGGAFWIDNNETTVNLENLVITKNYAHGNGGAIYCKGCKGTLNITDCTITDNTSDNYGGALYLHRKGNFMTVNLAGKVVIKSNSGKDNRNNITMRCSMLQSTCLRDVTGLTEGSEIYLAFSDFDGGYFTDEMEKSQAEILVGYFKGETSSKKASVVNDYGEYYLRIG